MDNRGGGGSSLWHVLCHVIFMQLSTANYLITLKIEEGANELNGLPGL